MNGRHTVRDQDTETMEFFFLYNRQQLSNSFSRSLGLDRISTSSVLSSTPIKALLGNSNDVEINISVHFFFFLHAFFSFFMFFVVFVTQKNLNFLGWNKPNLIISQLLRCWGPWWMSLSFVYLVRRNHI